MAIRTRGPYGPRARPLGLQLKLVGGRLLPGADSPAAFFMYETPAGERYTLYCAPRRRAGSALRYSTAGAIAAFH